MSDLILRAGLWLNNDYHGVYVGLAFGAVLGAGLLLDDYLRRHARY